MKEDISKEYWRLFNEELKAQWWNEENINWQKLFKKAEQLKIRYIKETFVGTNFEIDLKNGKIQITNPGKGLEMRGDSLLIANPISNKPLLTLNLKNQEVFFGNLPPMRLDWNRFSGPEKLKFNCTESGISIETDSIFIGTKAVSYEKLAKEFFNLMEVKGNSEYYKKYDEPLPRNLKEFFQGFDFSSLIEK